MIESGTRRSVAATVLVARWRPLGPITAINGLLLFAWSTAVIFEVLRRTLARTLDMPEVPDVR